MLKNKKSKSEKFSTILCLIGVLIFYSFDIRLLWALFDLIIGPKEIIIDDAQIKIHHSGGKYSIKHYYITGETLTHEYKSIEIGGDNSRENVAKLLEKNDKIKIM